MLGDSGGADAPTECVRVSLTVSASLATLSSDMGEYAGGDNDFRASSDTGNFHAELLRALDDMSPTPAHVLKRLLPGPS
jgi:hypothetical protein